VTPITSTPVLAASAATTLLSTPPDIATTMRLSAGGRSKAKSIFIGCGSLLEIHPVSLDRLNQRQKTRAGGLARHEGEFEAAAETSLEMGELLRALRRTESAAVRERQQAMACLLSASEGWRDAVERLNGAFAEEPTVTGLTDGKDK
jgi:hypothetical protein